MGTHTSVDCKWNRLRKILTAARKKLLSLLGRGTNGRVDRPFSIVRSYEFDLNIS